MDYKVVLKAIWDKSKLSFILSFFSVTFLYWRGFIVRPFRLVPEQLRNKLHAIASVPFAPDEAQKTEFEFAARQALLIFGMDDATILEQTYPGYDAYYVGEARNVRFTLITDDKNQQYYVGIRGSENEQNWIDNFTPEFVKDNELKATIHRGYRDVARSLLEQLEPLLLNKDYKIVIAGGSLGGVSSVAVGWYLDSRGYAVKQIYNFAGPRLTDDDYSHLNVLTVVNKLDAVWMLPLATLFHRYRHQGRRVLIIPALDYQDDKGSAEWRLYEDRLLTDFLLSSWGIDRKLDADEHLTYGTYFLRFLGKENELDSFG